MKFVDCSQMTDIPIVYHLFQLIQFFLSQMIGYFVCLSFVLYNVLMKNTHEMYKLFHRIKSDFVFSVLKCLACANSKLQMLFK